MNFRYKLFWIDLFIHFWNTGDGRRGGKRRSWGWWAKEGVGEVRGGREVKRVGEEE